jgi:hypothetical protein
MTDIERSWADKPRSRSFPTTTERTTTMKHFTKARTITVAVATGSAVVLAGGVAYAFWNTSGTGVATAAAGSAQGVTAGVTTALTSGSLYPSLSVPAVVTIHNPNTFPVKVTLVVTANSAIGTATVDATHLTAGCTSTNSQVALVGGTSGAINVPILAGGDSAAITAGTISMGLASDNLCQGATFSFAGASASSPSPVTITATAG